MNTRFDCNAFFGDFAERPSDSHAIIADSRFAGLVAARAGLAAVEAFKLRPDSPCIGIGSEMHDSERMDLWGNALPAGRRCVGAHEWVGG